MGGKQGLQPRFMREATRTPQPRPGEKKSPPSTATRYVSPSWGALLAQVWQREGKIPPQRWEKRTY